MFNHSGKSYRFNNRKVIGGIAMGDYNSHRTLFAGPDPADSNRVLIRKLVQTSDNVWCFEESRVTPSEIENGQPTVHSTLHRLGGIDLNESLDETEYNFRLTFRSMPNVIGASLFSRALSGRSGHFSIVEATMAKQSDYRWAEWVRDF